MKSPPRFARVLVALFATGALLPAAWPAELGAIVGRLTTAAGAPVANATVTAMRSDDGASRATLSASDGVHSFGDLPPGSWTVTAQVDGLPTVSTPALVVVTRKATRSDLAMNVAPPAGPVAATPSPSPEMVAAAGAAVAASVPEALQAPPAAPRLPSRSVISAG